VYLLSESVHSDHYTPEEITIHKPLCVTSVLVRAEPNAGLAVQVELFCIREVPS